MGYDAAPGPSTRPRADAAPRDDDAGLAVDPLDGAGPALAADDAAADASRVTVRVGDGGDQVLDPAFASFVIPSEMMGIVANGKPSINMFFHGTATGTFSCAPDAGPTHAASILYRPVDAGSSYEANDSIGSCSIVVTEAGQVGGRVRGTFSATTTRLLAGPTPSTMKLTGSFDVTRGNDVQ